MQTDDLITLMAHTKPRRYKMQRFLTWGAVLGILAVLVAIIAGIYGIRPDIRQIFLDHAMGFKYGILGEFAALAGTAWWLSGQPARRLRAPLLCIIGLLGLLLTTTVFAYLDQPYTAFKAAVFDRAAFSCVGSILVLASATVFVLLRLSRSMAPTNATLHAVMTAMFAAALAGLAYGFHCQHDHPAYLALWYAGTALLFTVAATPLLAKKIRW